MKKHLQRVLAPLPKTALTAEFLSFGLLPPAMRPNSCEQGTPRQTLREAIRRISMTVLTLGFASGAGAITTHPDDIALVDSIVGPAGEHCDTAVAGGDYEEIFICGDEFFETSFNAVDGGGANVGDGGRYTRVPRADLAGPDEWASHIPRRPTGPNAAACNICHATPVGTSAGPNGLNVIRDPLHSGDPGQFIQRNTPHLMGSGALQLLAEEINEDLEAIRESARASGNTLQLVSKGVYYGTVTGDGSGEVTVNAEGIDEDLVPKPFQWKGTDVSLRGFTVGAMNDELGMQPVETAGWGFDGDGDGVINEVSVADITATVIYMAGQTRPHTEIELDQLRQILVQRGRPGRNYAAELGLPVLTAADIGAINMGEQHFEAIGCTECHKSSMPLNDTVFREPSENPNYNKDAAMAGLGAGDIVAFDTATDMLDNHIVLRNRFIGNFANLETDGMGRGIVRLYGDLKRHDMGPGLAESIDETGHGSSVWMTKELWGVGQTAQYLHDGRATTIAEAILEHGGEALAARNAFAVLEPGEQAELVRFLQNLVILKAPEED